MNVLKRLWNWMSGNELANAADVSKRGIFDRELAAKWEKFFVELNTEWTKRFPDETAPFVTNMEPLEFYQNYKKLVDVMKAEIAKKKEPANLVTLAGNEEFVNAKPKAKRRAPRKTKTVTPNVE